ncbi:hypothetical protein COV23_00995 [Candidatus Wolfebacteria bacterium CG10_big_fil_rev_8_21_14_0_10_31_9]|uniref:SIMPL domain-containing protein n=1 Tax=Candidatus Wolfebacteria bacterium CG10_big_fil_rev_8_21_14_0_10_31_9 TaxID=1975070 RepID=A0A2H0RCE5_9BACT|nr:MAG: hypothetical protein COV23_00995 [Candidatus Wolfebacteria bacterium CG10_big_fil_rev_8_21_14_0_10_31_9]
MNNNIKNVLSVVIVLAILILAYSAYIYSNSFANSQQGLSSRVFSVTGDGKITAIPDVAKFTFAIKTQGGLDIPNIQKENSIKTNTIIDFIKSQGVDSKDITTQNYNIYPKYEYYSCPITTIGIDSATPKPCPSPKIRDYIIDQTISVKVRDFTKIGELLSGVTEKGVNSISQISFFVDDTDKYKNQAREEAIKKAQEKATAIANSAGFKIGKLITIGENNYSPMPYDSYGMGEIATFAKASVTPTIEPGSQEITINVVLRYEIK